MLTGRAGRGDFHAGSDYLPARSTAAICGGSPSRSRSGRLERHVLDLVPRDRQHVVTGPRRLLRAVYIDDYERLVALGLEAIAFVVCNPGLVPDQQFALDVSHPQRLRFPRPLGTEHETDQDAE